MSEFRVLKFFSPAMLVLTLSLVTTAFADSSNQGVNEQLSEGKAAPPV